MEIYIQFTKVNKEGDNIKIIKDYITENPCYIKNQKITVKGLMLHSIGVGQPKAINLVKNYNNSNMQAAVHAFIDAQDGTIHQTLPWNMRGWHCGASANNTHIGIEMCEPAQIKYTSGSVFTVTNLKEAQKAATIAYNSAVELFAYLCNLYNLNPLKDGIIISHAEGYKRGIASNHGDPEHLWKGLKLSYTMDGFRTDVYHQMEGESEEMTQEQFNEMMNVYLTDLSTKTPSSWAEGVMNWGVQEGLVSGGTNGQLMAQKFITRQECVALLQRLYNKLKG